ncbi:hypothetical protein DFH09DRAFT_1331180 [Mycena vulgaris]|nr:hypothetical protein DFH09DRAFT_1331180 [Mycena vulgaris]
MGLEMVVQEVAIFSLKIQETTPAGGGDGSGGGPSSIDDDWESPLHRTRVKLRLKPNNADTYVITIGYTLKFMINRETELPINLADLTRPLSRPEVLALLDFEIETRLRETQVDRSYASIGFVTHREQSIFRRQFLDRGFHPPEKLYKHGEYRQIQWGIKGSLGYSQGSPLGTVNISHNRNTDTMLEATDSKAMPRSHMDHEMGEEWDEDNKSYSSYNIVYQPQDSRYSAAKSDLLEVKVGMGINLRPTAKQPLPQISFVNRNQVLIWVSDPTSKARRRGIVVLINSYLDNIRTDKKLEIYEQENVELNQAPLTVPTNDKERQKSGTLSLSIAQVEKQGASGSKKLVPSFFTKRSQQSLAAPPIEIPPHEYLARGWDVNNEEWKQVLWPALDKDFRAAALERTATVCTIQCKPKPAQKAVTAGTNTQP